MKIVVITASGHNMSNGPALSDALRADLVREADKLGISCEFFDGDSEGGLVTLIQNALNSDGVILNAGDYAGYSIAIRDAISSISKPVVEVCPANPLVDGNSSHTSMLSAVCKGVISGFGDNGYFLALHALSS